MQRELRLSPERAGQSGGELGQIAAMPVDLTLQRPVGGKLAGEGHRSSGGPVLAFHTEIEARRAVSACAGEMGGDIPGLAGDLAPSVQRHAA